MSIFIRIKKASARRGLVFFISPFLLIGCASYQHRVEDARRQLSSGNAHTAVEKLAPLANNEGKDQLVYLLDLGTAAQLAGDYPRSTRAFLAADQMSEVKDYHSISKLTGSLLFNQGMVQYKGDDYEKVLINAMLAINYLMMNNLDEALVETRRLNEKLHHYKFDAKKNYEQNVFAFYLSALIWEADRKWDDAYIDFKKAYDLDPSIPYLKEDLVRAAYNARRMKSEREWREKFGLKRPKDPDFQKSGELVVIYQQGWGPRKRPNPAWRRLPKLFPTFNRTRAVEVKISGGQVERSQQIYSVEEVAIKTLSDQYAGLIAKRMAGIAAKRVAADQVRQKNKLLGNILELGMIISDQADLRQWSTLPQTFQIAKIQLKPGNYSISIDGLTEEGAHSGESMPTKNIVINPRKKTFITWRSFN